MKLFYYYFNGKFKIFKIWILIDSNFIYNHSEKPFVRKMGFVKIILTKPKVNQEYFEVTWRLVIVERLILGYLGAWSKEPWYILFATTFGSKNIKCMILILIGSIFPSSVPVVLVLVFVFLFMLSLVLINSLLFSN